MTRQLWPAITLRDADFETPEKSARAVRLVYQTVGKAFQDLQREGESDPARRASRVAHALKGMGANLHFVDNPQKSPGDLAYLLDQYRWTFGPVTGSGGVSPSITGPLLDGVRQTDTVAQTPSKGSLIVGKTSPSALWDELVAGTNGYSLIYDSTQTLGLRAVNPNNVLLDADHHTDTDNSVAPINGDMIIRTGGVWAVVSIGLADKFWKSNGTAPSWQASLAKTGAAKVDATGQAAAIGATTLVSTAGFYQVDYYLVDTTADVTAGTIQFQVNYTDDAGATLQVSAALVLTALGRTSGSFQVYLTSGNLQYQTNLVGIIGTSRYALFVRVLNLG